MRIKAIPFFIFLPFLTAGCNNPAMPYEVTQIDQLDSQGQVSNYTPMPDSTYEQQAANLSKAIDISIQVFKDYPPQELNTEQLQLVNTSLQQFRKMVREPEPQFRNTKSLKFLEASVFAYFQEGKGPTVDAFWKAIKENKLPYKKEDMLSKILKRGKIADRIEYDYIIDGIVVFQQEGRITEKEVIELNRMIGEYEESGEGE